ncbi:hypothetical protein V4210_02610 [Candidatus Nanosynbacter sp. BB002]|uniref:PIN/TRAM domain-containing protein n=1 Tax=Candidatus Nanosynbacter sp. BB002 TaxID=3393757 RepID=UPI0030CED2EE
MEKTIELLIIIMLLAIMAEIYLLVKPRRHTGSGTQLPILVDTSVLMDGRVVDLAKTGFLLGQIIVPRSVLIELQLLADGADHAKRERARFGMDVMKELKDVLGSSFTLLDDATRIPEGVDNRLLQLAKEMNAAILTLDYNLNKVAQVEGIQILNINELAKSLRMSYLPGDELVLELTQKGQDSHQAVGYLHDGTMVVVEQAKKFLGQKKRIEIIRSLQTDAGKMMFAKVVEQTTPPEPTRQTAVIAKRRSVGRKVQTSPEGSAKKTTKKPAVKTQKPVQQTRRRSTTTKTSAQREAERLS